MAAGKTAKRAGRGQKPAAPAGGRAAGPASRSGVRAGAAALPGIELSAIGLPLIDRTGQIQKLVEVTNASSATYASNRSMSNISASTDSSTRPTSCHCHSGPGGRGCHVAFAPRRPAPAPTASTATTTLAPRMARPSTARRSRPGPSPLRVGSEGGRVAVVDLLEDGLALAGGCQRVECPAVANQAASNYREIAGSGVGLWSKQGWSAGAPPYNSAATDNGTTVAPPRRSNRVSLVKLKRMSKSFATYTSTSRV